MLLIRRVKLTRPIALWMKDPTIVSDQQKKKSNTKRTRFFVKRCHQKILKPYEILFVDRVLNKQQKRTNCEPSEINNYFSNLAANLTNKENTESNFTTLLNNLPGENYDQSFHLKHINYNEVYKIITNLKNNCSSSHDNIPVWYLKHVAEYITSPMVHIINTSNDQEIFTNVLFLISFAPL